MRWRPAGYAGAMPEPVNLQDRDRVIECLDRAAELLRQSAHRRGCCAHLPAEGRLLVTGDLHDNPAHLQKIIHAARLDQGDDRHVILQEMIHGERLINGLDLSHRMLIRAAELVTRYPRQVHPVLANHELSQMTGRGVSKGAGNSVELFNDGLEYAFSQDWFDVAEAIGRFIAAMPLALRTERGVFCAHSLPGESAMRAFDPDILERELTAEDYERDTGSAYLMVWGRRQPASLINELAERWGVSLFCLGHQHTESGIEAIAPNALILNSDHQAGRVLSVDLSDPPDIETAVLGAMPLSAISA